MCVSVGSPGAGVVGGCELPRWVLGSELVFFVKAAGALRLSYAVTSYS